MKLLLTSVVLFCITTLRITFAQEALTYQIPPKAIADIIDHPPTPGISISTDNQWLLLIGRDNLPSIEQLAQPELRIGGLRINPRTNGSSRGSYSKNLTLKNIISGEEYSITGMPENPRIASVSWSPDGSGIAFTHTTSNAIELWVVNISARSAKKMEGFALNDAMWGNPFEWLSNSREIIARIVPASRGEIPEKPLVPSGPVISENMGKVAAVRTYQDLLKNNYDESLFEYFTQSQLAIINVETGGKTLIGSLGMYQSFEPSPDGNYFLIQQIHKPFSYLVPYSRFPQKVDILDRQGKLVKRLAEIPSAEDIPKGFMAVRKGPRSFDWRTDAPATLYWVEALDEGDPENDVEFRDQVFWLQAPFTSDAQKLLTTKLRFSGINWGNDELALVYEFWWNTRKEVTRSFSPSDPAKEARVIFDRSTEDRYTDPGNFRTQRNAWGRWVLLTDTKKNYLYLSGQGASSEGDRPFLDQYELKTGKTTRIWQSEAPYYEYVVALQDLKKNQILISRESNTEPPNLFSVNLRGKKESQLTSFPHPYPQLAGIQKQLIHYQRDDGIDLTGKLYLPAGYNPEKDGPIPTLLWAYPREFKSADAAGQVSGSPFQFVRIYGGSPLFWLTQGYAILDDPSMPIVGEGDQEPNDRFVKQLVANAAAAIDKLVDMGVTDRTKVAIGGHSYGAFMTANLLAHSDLFSCGIARSGAYNRTLTPFGFQAEERTFWEAPEVYFAMSPFMHANKVNEPILLIHGLADNNSGTFPIQSERFYNALKGHGANARLVMLPHESHGYQARESVLHMLWEMTVFMEKHMGKGFETSSR